jgi:hypothetical protein
MNSQLLRQVDRATWSATLCVVVGWFFMATLVTTFGPVRHAYHFFDLLTVMRDPTWLLHGMGSSHPLEAIAFGLVNLAVIALPLAPYVHHTRSTWLLCAAPLALMLLCGIVLYARTSGPYVEATGSGGALGDYIARLGNSVALRAAASISRHISLGMGAYLSFIASVFLAVKGAREFRARADVLASPAASVDSRQPGPPR